MFLRYAVPFNETVNMDRENIRSLLSKAANNRPAVEIADELGFPASNLYDFISRGTLGKAKLALVERWLIDHGFIQEQTYTRREQIALELEHTAAILRSSAYTDDQKDTALKRLVDVLPGLIVKR